jgi:hypothetical protein
MPLAALFSAAILETVLIRLAALFLTGAGGDSIAARQAALQMPVPIVRKPRMNFASPPTSSVLAFTRSKRWVRPPRRTYR